MRRQDLDQIGLASPATTVNVEQNLFLTTGLEVPDKCIVHYLLLWVERIANLPRQAFNIHMETIPLHALAPVVGLDDPRVSVAADVGCPIVFDIDISSTQEIYSLLA